MQRARWPMRATRCAPGCVHGPMTEDPHANVTYLPCPVSSTGSGTRAQSGLRPTSRNMSMLSFPSLPVGVPPPWPLRMPTSALAILGQPTARR
eukprot:6226333-Prymnesium_polylepis.1